MTVGEMVGEVSKVGTALMQAVSAVSATAARIANAVRLAQAQLEASSAMLVKAARWWVTELPALTQAYCLPYDREIKRLGLPPLTPQERADCLLAAILMAEPEEIGPRHRMPLVEVALLAGRADVVARLNAFSASRIASFPRRNWLRDASLFCCQISPSATIMALGLMCLSRKMMAFAAASAGPESSLAI